jgi:hypothetical protein
MAELGWVWLIDPRSFLMQQAREILNSFIRGIRLHKYTRERRRRLKVRTKVTTVARSSYALLIAGSDGAFPLNVENR